ncbi:MAG: metal ABC transporter permease [Lautropia sp.]|nr:metal ABC transporter permease [Lautropia sp.]
MMAGNWLDGLHQALQGGVAAGWLPAMLHYGFVVNALLAGCLLGPLLGGLGTLVVIKRFAFFSEAVGHAALTGIAIGIMLGEPAANPYGSLFGFCILFGLLLNYLRGRTGLSPDTLIGVFLAVSLALGSSLLLLLAARINIHILENVLFGSVLTVDGRDLSVLAVVTLATMVALHRIYNRAMLASFHAPLAQARKLPVQWIDYVFVMLVTLITVAAVKVIGAMLVGALLVIPAATARMLAGSMRSFFWLTVIIATVCTLVGIAVPVAMDIPVPSGAAIILCAGIVFGGAVLLKGRVSRNAA